MNDNITVTATYNLGAEIDISSKKPNYPIKEFSILARLNYLKTRGYSPMDVFDIMLALPKPQARLLKELKDNMDWKTNVSILPPETTKSKKIARSKNLKELVLNNLIKRIYINMYLINPELIVPSGYLQEDILGRWKQLP